MEKTGGAARGDGEGLGFGECEVGLRIGGTVFPEGAEVEVEERTWDSGQQKQMGTAAYTSVLRGTQPPPPMQVPVATWRRMVGKAGRDGSGRRVHAPGWSAGRARAAGGCMLDQAAEWAFLALAQGGGRRAGGAWQDEPEQLGAAGAGLVSTMYESLRRACVLPVCVCRSS